MRFSKTESFDEFDFHFFLSINLEQIRFAKYCPFEVEKLKARFNLQQRHLRYFAFQKNLFEVDLLIYKLYKN